MTLAPRRAAIQGAFLGDSLALGLHWIYDAQDVAQKAAPHLDDGVFTALLAPGLGSHHTGKAAGAFTHYGDQALVLLESVAAANTFALETFFEQWQALFKGYMGYVDGATRGTMERIQAGAEATGSGSPSHDLAGAARMAPLLAVLGGDLPPFIEAARAQTKMTHNTAEVLDTAEFLARTTYHLLQGMAMEAALRTAAEADYPSGHIAEWVEDGLDTAGMNSIQAVADLGQSCSASGALPAVVHLAATYDGDFAKGLSQNVLAGGDSAARGMALGMLLGAQAGASIPQAWLDGLAAGPRIEELLQKTLG